MIDTIVWSIRPRQGESYAVTEVFAEVSIWTEERYYPLHNGERIPCDTRTSFEEYFEDDGKHLYFTSVGHAIGFCYGLLYAQTAL